jgi:hypothetical protein
LPLAVAKPSNLRPIFRVKAFHEEFGGVGCARGLAVVSGNAARADIITFDVSGTFATPEEFRQICWSKFVSN